jgi:hypothetical protein
MSKGEMQTNNAAKSRSEKAQEAAANEGDKFQLTCNVSREDVKNLRRVMAWAEANRTHCERRIEQRREEAARMGAGDLQAEIKCKMLLLRATKDWNYYDGIRGTAYKVLGQWKSDQIDLFPDEEAGDGDTERPASGEEVLRRAESAVSGGRDVPEAGEGAGDDTAERSPELAGDGE